MLEIPIPILTPATCASKIEPKIDYGVDNELVFLKLKFVDGKLTL